MKKYHLHLPTLVISLLCLTSAVASEFDGQLVSPGEGEGASLHQLPETAINTKQLPHTRLSETDSAEAPLPFYRLAPDTYFFYGNISTINDDNRGFNGNAGFVVTDKSVVVIDALGTPKLAKRMIATIRSVTDKPIRYLILTHNHPDHAYGASSFRALPEKVTVISHAGVEEYLGSQTQQNSIAYREELLKSDMQAFEEVVPDLYLPTAAFEPYELVEGNKTFHLYNVGEHHSHGDLVVHQVDDDILWISDLAFNQRVTFMGDGNSLQALKGQRWLLDNFDDDTLMVPGHGSAQTAPYPMVTRSMAYIEGLREMMQQQLDAGASLLDAVEEADMPDWKKVPLYDENQRANASFIYREMEFDFF